MKQEQSTPASSSSFNEKLRGLLFPFQIARRYLFSKKSHNVVNIISAISAIGICFGAMAMVCVLSVFNGLESLISLSYSHFDPDLKITIVEGKTFDTDSAKFATLRTMPSVVFFTEVIEGNALLDFNDKQMPAIVKGVSDEFRQMTMIDSIMYDGEFILFDGGFDRIVAGIGVASTLGFNAHFVDPVKIVAPKRTSKINTLRPENSFVVESAFASGIFMVEQMQYDDNYVLISIKQARELFQYSENTVSSIELKVAEDANFEKTQKEIQQLLGNNYNVKNRYEQQESFYKIMKMEKWITYLILCFILLIASFNIIGSLSMLIIDKKEDINTLRNLGADSSLIKRIFLFEGWMISAVGALSGIVLGTLLCSIQQHFGLLRMGENFIVNAYPVAINFVDVALVFITVLLLGLIAAYYPVRYINSKQNLSQKD